MYDLDIKKFYKLIIFNKNKIFHIIDQSLKLKNVRISSSRLKVL